MSKLHTILPIRNNFFILSTEKTERVQVIKESFPNNCFITRVMKRLKWLYTVVFKEHDILKFKDNVDLFKFRPIKEPQNFFDSFNCSNQTDF